MDGQQRLTSLSILLCAIRDHLRNTDAEGATRIDDLYLLNKWAKGLSRYTVLPTQADRKSWISLVERTPDAGGEDPIGIAYNYFLGVLAVGAEDGRPFDLEQLEQIIVARLSIVEIAAHADDNVYRIFESSTTPGSDSPRRTCCATTCSCGCPPGPSMSTSFSGCRYRN